MEMSDERISLELTREQAEETRSLLEWSRIEDMLTPHPSENQQRRWSVWQEAESAIAAQLKAQGEGE